MDVFRGPSGFGLSVDGGIDTTTAFRGLIRIKRLFPYQPAWLTGMIQAGDILLRANNERLTGLTNEVSGNVLKMRTTNFSISIISLLLSTDFCVIIHVQQPKCKFCQNTRIREIVLSSMAEPYACDT